VTINYLELVQFYILSHTLMPKSYLNGATIGEAHAKNVQSRTPKCRLLCWHFCR